jgi:hypothetical protein
MVWFLGVWYDPVPGSELTGIERGRGREAV